MNQSSVSSPSFVRKVRPDVPPPQMVVVLDLAFVFVHASIRLKPEFKLPNSKSSQPTDNVPVALYLSSERPGASSDQVLTAPATDRAILFGRRTGRRTGASTGETLDSVLVG